MSFEFADDPFLCAVNSSWPGKLWSRDLVLVGVSGGADSVALLLALCRLASGPGRVVAAHFNHRLRPAAGEDEQFVVDLCCKLQIECRAGRAEETSPACDEASARDARYAFLQSTACELGATYVALAHTQDDQVETILHRILRGAGLAGLAGIPRTRKLGPIALVRPLLEMTRHEVEQFLQRQNQAYRKDDSNEDVRYTRNRLRHELLPILRENFNAQVDAALLRLAGQAGQAHAVLRGAAEKLYLRAAVKESDAVVFDLSQLHSQPEIVLQELFVYLWIEQHWPRGSMGAAQWQRLAEMVRGQGDMQIDFPSNITAQKIGDSLRLNRRV